jgi:hypothetical protein
VGQDAGDPFGLEAVEPVVDGVGVAGPQQPGAGHGMGGGSGGDLEQGGAALADIGSGVVVAEVL